MGPIFKAPGAASQTAAEIDSVFIFISVITAFFFVVTQSTLIYFAIKYRRRKGETRETPYITKNLPLEIVWAVIPSFLVLAIFYYGYSVFMKLKTPLPGAQEIQVVARQWLFEFKYPDGRTAVNELHLPVGKPVQLSMTSSDVIHSFYIPEYRINQDILPGRYTYLWFTPDKTGEYVVFCNQYCGAGHSEMLAKLIIMTQHDYDGWAAGFKEEKAEAMPLAKRGEELVKSSGCLACHTVDGTVKVGPTFKGLYGSKVTLETGETVTADDNYIKESMIDPGAKIVKGFQNVMPTFKGTLSDDDVTAIIAYLKTLK